MRSAASSGCMASSTSAARSTSRPETISTASSSLSSSSTSARRSTSSSAATSRRRAVGRSWSTSATSAGLRSSRLASRAVAACCSGRPARLTTAPTSTRSVSPRRKESPRPPPVTRRTKSLVTAQSRLRCCSIATSSMLARPEPSRNVTTRSRSWETTSVSLARCSKRRMFTRPVVMTAPGSIPVTRVSGTNTRRRPLTSTTSPTARGAPLSGISTTTSCTLPTSSPMGSKTDVPARRAT